MNLDIRSFGHDDGRLAAHVHFHGGREVTSATYNFDEIEVTYPALHRAIEEVERCIAGAIILHSQQVAALALPESTEVDLGLCKVCGDPVRASDPGSLRNGPFLYCPKHSR